MYYNVSALVCACYQNPEKISSSTIHPLDPCRREKFFPEKWETELFVINRRVDKVWVRHIHVSATNCGYDTSSIHVSSGDKTLHCIALGWEIPPMPKHINHLKHLEEKRHGWEKWTTWARNCEKIEKEQVAEETYGWGAPTTKCVTSHLLKWYSQETIDYIAI